ncbi:hypothetical protein IQ07DRAFT_644096 [Pyrenochaeta sp. DS3sAY3a]|nr:hypothetical protein IQ07DRAFT_644096 [Pyrenochaeta sp. DS3sAY3a]
MQLTTLAVLFASLVAFCSGFAVPGNLDLAKRQTFVITCISNVCSGPTGSPDPEEPEPSSKTTSKPNPPKSSSKSTPKPTPTPTPTPKSSSKSTTKPPPEPTPTPTKTTTLKSTPKPPVTTPTKTSGGEVGPSSTACPVPLYYQCGGYYDGKPWSGCTKCVKGAKCVVQNEFYNQCVADE